MWCCFCPRAQRTLETGSVEYLIDPPSCLSTLPPPQVRRSDCRDMVNPGILTCLPRFPGLPVGPRCPAIPGSPFGPISPWKDKKRSKRGIRACGAGRSLQVYPVTGHEGSLLDHSKSFPGGLLWNWKSDVRACERWVVFFHGRGGKGEGYPEWVICYLRETAAEQHTFWCPKLPSRTAHEAPAFQSHVCL